MRSGEVDPDVARSHGKRHPRRARRVSVTPVWRSRHRARRAHSTASSGSDSGGVVRPAIRAIAAAATCATSTAQSPTLGVQPCRTLNVNGGMGDGGRVVAAACFRRPEQEDSKSNSSHLPGPLRALNQSQ
jgi:hypothetical protein